MKRGLYGFEGDGPSIIEENGPILLLTMAEYFAVHRPSINIE
jgi:hypothetical protein